MPGPRAVQNLQMPHPGTDKAGKCPVVARRGGGGGGGWAGRRWNWLMHNQTSRLGTYNKTNLILKTTEWLIYRVLSLYIICIFSSTSCCFFSGITLKIVAFFNSLRLRVCVVVFIHEKENWKCFSRLLSRHFFHHALITWCNVSLAGYIAWCITIGIHLILVKATWLRINQVKVSWVKV